jgi:hypothetical protein
LDDECFFIWKNDLRQLFRLFFRNGDSKCVLCY